MRVVLCLAKFPFLFGGTFIEGVRAIDCSPSSSAFPFLFGGTFIEGFKSMGTAREAVKFPFLFGGTFIEGVSGSRFCRGLCSDFPSFSEGLSLREQHSGEG